MAKENKPIVSRNLLVRLTNEVETTAHIKPSTPKDFESLTEAIYSRTAVMLSPTTLKRIWGYLDESVTPRHSTLNVLSRFCGWADFEHFMFGISTEIESGNVGSKVIRAGEDICPGERLRIFWHPSRVCEIEYQGNYDWIVKAAEGTRLKPGDRFRCPLIISGEPLYLDNLIKDGNKRGVYVCGSKRGITFEIVNNDEKD